MSYENAHVPYFLEKYFPSILTEKLGRHSLKKGAFIFGNRGAISKPCKKITQKVEENYFFKKIIENLQKLLKICLFLQYF